MIFTQVGTISMGGNYIEKLMVGFKMLFQTYAKLGIMLLGYGNAIVRKRYCCEKRSCVWTKAKHAVH